MNGYLVGGFKQFLIGSLENGMIPTSMFVTN